MSTYGLSVVGADLQSLAQTAQAADAAGFDAAWASEFYHRSGSISMAALANRTQNCRIGSSILYGVGRSPLVLATEARDLDELSNGRLVLGIGNGTQRMMSDWHGVSDTSAPALRMEELVALLRRIWNLHEGPVRHHGRFYTMDLVPTGDVPPLPRPIPIVTAGVRPRMCEAAGRVADGLAGHPLFTTTYVQEVVRPAIAKGAAEKFGMLSPVEGFANIEGQGVQGVVDACAHPLAVDERGGARVGEVLGRLRRDGGRGRQRRVRHGGSLCGAGDTLPARSRRGRAARRLSRGRPGR